MTVKIAMAAEIDFRCFFLIMVRKKAQQKRQEIFFGIVIAASLFSIAGFLMFSNLKIARRRKELSSRIDGLKKELDELSGRNQELEEGLWESEKGSYWEARIRELGYQKPGEEVVVIKKEGETIQEEHASENFWQRFLGQVKGILPR